MRTQIITNPAHVIDAEAARNRALQGIIEAELHDHESDPLSATDYERIAAANRSANVTPVGERHGLDSGKRFNKAAQATAATIRLMDALKRAVFFDVMSAWADLMQANDINPSPLSSGPVFWGDMTDAIKHALLSGHSPDSVLLWAKADEAVRGYALVLADAKTADAKKVQGDDHWDDVDEPRQEEIKLLHSQAARLTAFAAGRA